MKQPLASSGAVWTHCRAAVLVGLLAGSMAASAKPVLVVDGDADGVSDELDDCPYSLPDEAVDGRGCGIAGDADGDGVSDAADLCPYTDDGAVVDSDGCALDDDFDGVANGIDQCPATLLGERVDRRGCEPGTAPTGRNALAIAPPAAAVRPAAPAAEPAVSAAVAPAASAPAAVVAPTSPHSPAAAVSAATPNRTPVAVTAPPVPKPGPVASVVPPRASAPAIATPASPAPPHVPGAVEVAESLAEISFEAHAAALTPAARGRVLALVAEVKPRLASMPGTMLRLAGHHHIDEKPELEAQRSASLRDALIAAGIPAASIRIDHPTDARRRDGSGRRVSIQFLMTR